MARRVRARVLEKVRPFCRDVARASARGHLAFQDRGTMPAGQGMATAWLWVWNVAHRAPAQTWDWKSYGLTMVGSSTVFVLVGSTRDRQGAE